MRRESAKGVQSHNGQVRGERKTVVGGRGGRSASGGAAREVVGRIESVDQ